MTVTQLINEIIKLDTRITRDQLYNKFSKKQLEAMYKRLKKGK